MTGTTGDTSHAAGPYRVLLAHGTLYIAGLQLANVSVVLPFIAAEYDLLWVAGLLYAAYSIGIVLGNALSPYVLQRTRRQNHVLIAGHGVVRAGQPWHSLLQCARLGQSCRLRGKPSRTGDFVEHRAGGRCALLALRQSEIRRPVNVRRQRFLGLDGCAYLRGNRISPGVESCLDLRDRLRSRDRREPGGLQCGPDLDQRLCRRSIPGHPSGVRGFADRDRIVAVGRGTRRARARTPRSWGRWSCCWR